MSKLTKFNPAALTANEQNNAQGGTWGSFGSNSIPSYGNSNSNLGGSSYSYSYSSSSHQPSSSYQSSYSAPSINVGGFVSGILGSIGTQNTSTFSNNSSQHGSCNCWCW